MPLMIRSNVPHNPKNDVNAAEDFLEVNTLICSSHSLICMLLYSQIILKGHVVAAVMDYFNMDDNLLHISS